MLILDQDSAGNYRKAQNFCWHDMPEDADERALVYTVNRDSDLLTRCNAKVIDEAMAPFVEDGSVTIEHHNHWACGWIDGYSIKVLQPHVPVDNDGISFYSIDHKFFVLTPAAQKWNELAERMNNYPVLDEHMYEDMVEDAIADLSEYDCQTIASERMKVEDAFELNEKTIRSMEDFWDKAYEWVTED